LVGQIAVVVVVVVVVVVGVVVVVVVVVVVESVVVAVVQKGPILKIVVDLLSLEFLSFFVLLQPFFFSLRAPKKKTFKIYHTCCYSSKNDHYFLTL
jgi:hypothetical protein